MENNRNYVISGEYVETSNRQKGDQLLLNAIESERYERMEAVSEIMNTLDTIKATEFEIGKRLRNHEHVLNFLIGLGIGLLISMILIAWQM